MNPKQSEVWSLIGEVRHAYQRSEESFFSLWRKTNTCEVETSDVVETVNFETETETWLKFRDETETETQWRF